jgi:predicted Zn-dependent peptidase
MSQMSWMSRMITVRRSLARRRPGFAPCAAAIALWLAVLTPVGTSAQSAVQGVTEFTVNGLKVLVKQRPASQTVAAGLFIRGGSRNVTAANAGIEALMLDLATEASANFPRETLRRELARTASAVSFGVNYDYSAFSLGTTRQYFDRAWQIFADCALRPSLTPEDFSLVKQRRLTNLSDDQDDPDSSLRILQAAVSYAGHPYQNDPRGTVGSVEHLTLEDVRRFHQQMMQTSRLLLVIVGDLDPQEVQRKVTASFSSLPAGAYQAAALPPLSFSAPTVAVTPRDLPTNYVQGVYAAPPITSPDIYPIRVATNVLRNRVFQEVRVNRSLSYAPDAFLSEQGANVGGIYVTAVDANQAVQVMLDEVGKLQAQEISTDELKAITQSFLTTHYLDQETNAAQAGALARDELIGGGWRSSANLLERLRAVTPQDVRRVANTYMRNFQFVVLGNPSKIDQQFFLRQPGSASAR